MIKSTSSNKLHVAIIMDGNGRWATARGLPRLAGHRAGAHAVRRTVEAAVDLGVGALTLYAFSSDNWKRPSTEVAGLIKLFQVYLTGEMPNCVRNGIRFEAIGRRDRLDHALIAVMEEVERQTAGGTNLHLRIAIDYSGREAILRAARRINQAAGLSPLPDLLPDVDLLIRTGGEQRLSDFLLWENAYAELIFTQCMWPDFRRQDLESALSEFRRRDRRFGGLPDEVLSGSVV
jgi:undecaprenyl diphosphate synthase